jgi:hypothetical protein
MKITISFVLLAFMLLLGIAKSEVASAQGNGLLERTVPMYSSELYSIPLVCYGVEVDHLNGKLDIFCRMHYENGSIVWMIHNFSGFLTSSRTGEVFEINGTRKIDSVEKDYTFRANIAGDLGSHYILFGSSNTLKPTDLTIYKAVCPSGAGQ